MKSLREDSMQKRDLVARIIGLLTFALGIAVLIVSFIFAFKLFTSPTAGLAMTPAQPGGPSAASTLGQSAISLLIRIGALFMMVLAGSLTAGRGAQMYCAGTHQTKAEDQ